MAYFVVSESVYLNKTSGYHSGFGDYSQLKFI
jgi:hypothetical protein